MNNPFSNVLKNAQQLSGDVIQGAKYTPNIIGGALNNATSSVFKKKLVMPKPTVTKAPQNTWASKGKQIADYAKNQQAEVNKINQLTQ